MGLGEEVRWWVLMFCWTGRSTGGGLGEGYDMLELSLCKNYLSLKRIITRIYIKYNESLTIYIKFKTFGNKLISM